MRSLSSKICGEGLIFIIKDNESVNMNDQPDIILDADPLDMSLVFSELGGLALILNTMSENLETMNKKIASLKSEIDDLKLRLDIAIDMNIININLD